MRLYDENGVLNGAGNSLDLQTLPVIKKIFEDNLDIHIQDIERMIVRQAVYVSSYNIMLAEMRKREN